MIINPILVGGGFDINGVLEQYAVSSGSISAGDFVEFANGLTNANSDVGNGGSVNTGGKTSVIELSGNRVLLVYPNGQNQIRAVVCTISGESAVAGVETQICSITGCGYYPQAVKLSDSSVFVVFGGEVVDSYHKLGGFVCQISGSTITAGSASLLIPTSVGAYATGEYAKAVVMGTNKVLAVGMSGTVSSFSVVVTVNGTSLSMGTAVRSEIFSGRSPNARGGQLVKISDGKATLLYYESNTEYLYGILLNVSGSAVTAGTYAQLSSETLGISGPGFCAAYISGGRFCVMTSFSDGPSALLFDASGSSILSVAQAQIANKPNILFLLSGSSYLAVREMGITSTSVGAQKYLITQTSVAADGSEYSLDVGDSDITAFGGTAALLGAAIAVNVNANMELLLFSEGVKPYQSVIGGVAASSGSAGDTIDVYIPE